MLPPPTLLLTTKLYRPPADANWVARPALMERLQQGLRSKLILISAPPGFGKSTLASHWLASCSLPSAWLSLDEGDNDLIQFLRYLLAAVRTCAPAACPTTQSLLTATNPPDVDYLADVLVSELTALTQPLILVLDDFHAISASEVHRVMRHLLRYRPPALHPVILTRTDPPLHLGRLRAAQQITEIRASDLRFGLAETRQFLQMHGDQPLNEELVRALQTRTEGWAIGLQLACLSLQNQAPEEVVARFGGGNRLLMGYLVEEVMAGLPGAVAEFLTRSALVDRFCAPLGDALMVDSPWPGTSQATIAQLEARNLFVIPLDDEGAWYRYHDLFRSFLLHRLKHEQGPDGVARLHQRAGVWLAQAGLIEAALRHSLAGGDERFAADLVEAQLHPLVNRRVPMYTLARWLDLFAADTIQAHPGLLIAQASLAVFGIGPPLSPLLFTQSEQLLEQGCPAEPDRRQSLRADLALLRGIYAYTTGELSQAISYLQQAVATLPLAHEFARAQAYLYLAAVYASTGEFATGEALIDAGLAEATAQHRPTMVILLGAHAILRLYAARLPAVVQTVERMVTVAATLQIRPAWQGVGYVDIWCGRAHYFQGVVAYEQNDLDAASHHWRQVETLHYRTHPAPYHDSLVGQALVAQARGAPGDALAYAQAAREFAAETHNLALQANSEALAVRLALLAGETTEAVRRSQDFAVAANQGSAFSLTLPALTRVIALLAEASPASLALALKITEACLGHAEKMNNAYLTIQVTLLHALTRQALGERAEATRALAQALTLGEPGGFLRTFLDLGAPMAELLHSYNAPHDQAGYVNRLLAAFTKEHDPTQRRDLTAHYARFHGITPLTPRELELLTLSGQGLTIAEIAATLVISPNTVKKHSSNIYTKLGVRNGRQALAKAQDLGLL